MSDIGETEAVILPPVSDESTPESGAISSGKTIWEEKREERVKERAGVQSASVSEAGLAKEETPEAQAEWRRKIKEQDEELSLVMQGKKKKEVEGALDQDGVPQKTFVVEDDPELTGKSPEERRIMVIDKKTQFLSDAIKEKYGEAGASQQANQVVEQIFGSEDQRKRIQEKITKKNQAAGKDTNLPEVKQEIDEEVNEAVAKNIEAFQRRPLEKMFGDVEQATDMIDANIDFEELLRLICAQEVSGGRFGTMPKKEGSGEEVSLEDIVQLAVDKKRIFSVALNAVGYKSLLLDWGESDDPQNVSVISETLYREIYPNPKKALLFAKTFFAAAGYMEQARELSDPSIAQKYVLELQKGEFLQNKT